MKGKKSNLSNDDNKRIHKEIKIKTASRVKISKLFRQDEVKLTKQWIHDLKKKSLTLSSAAIISGGWSIGSVLLYLDKNSE
jgi:hypothetical protein